MGGSTKQSQETRQDNTIDPWSRSLITQGRNNIRRIQSDNPFEGYDGERVAGLSGLEAQARDQFMSTQGQGADLMGLAAGAAMEAGGYRPEQVSAQSFRDADLSGYMNPHLDGIKQNRMSEIDRDRAQTQASNRDQMLAGGSWGGSRSGVVQAETDRNYADLKARTANEIDAQNFDRAATMFTADANRAMQADTTNANLGLAGAQMGLQGAGLLADIGQGLGEANRAEAGFLSMLGANERNIADRRNAADYDEFMRRQGFGRQLISEELAMMGMTPTIVDSSGTSTTTQSSNPGLLGIAGLGMQGAALFSDRRLKRDIRPDGTMGELPAYYFRYVWEAPDAPPHRGVMADEVARTCPNAITTHESGYAMVDYSMLEAA